MECFQKVLQRRCKVESLCRGRQPEIFEFSLEFPMVVLAGVDGPVNISILEESNPGVYRKYFGQIAHLIRGVEAIQREHRPADVFLFLAKKE